MKKGLFSYVAIPCVDFERAFNFYFTLTGGRLQRNPSLPFPMAYFTDDQNKNVGHLFQLEKFKPSADGTIVYLELAKDLNETLSIIEQAGGKIVMPKTSLGPAGFWAMFLDSEGNRLALHSEE